MDDTIYQKIREKTKEYLHIPSVVGSEVFFLDYLKKDFEKLGVTTQRNETYLLIGDNAQKDILLSAHIDRHGLLVNQQGEIEFAYYTLRRQNYDTHRLLKSMGWDDIRNRFLGQTMSAYDSHTGKVIATGVIQKIQISSDAQKAFFYGENLMNLPVGTPLGYTYQQQEIQNIIGQIDNVLSVAIIYVLYEYGYTGAAIFTTLEEIGKSYLQIQEYLNTLHKSIKLLIIDTTPMNSEDESMFKNIVLRNKDNTGEFDKNLTQLLKNIAQEQNIHYIVKDEWILQNTQDTQNIYYGDTELGELVKATQGKYNGTTLQVPTKNYHTNRDEAYGDAVKNMFCMLEIFAKNHNCWQDFTRSGKEIYYTSIS